MTGTAPLALVVGAPGTNRGGDAATALELAGARAEHVSITDLMLRPAVMRSAHMLVVAGGFSHADALGAGRLFARSLARLAEDELGSFIARRRPVIGICNGFQALVGAGLLPGALGHNASGHFQCEWVTLHPVQDSVCVWTKNLEPFDCPIAHGEGRYVHPDHEALQRSGQVALRYECDPNGSVASVAGVCDSTGVVLGLMPHPENHCVARQHPLYRRRGPRPLGLQLFERGLAHAREIA